MSVQSALLNAPIASTILRMAAPNILAQFITVLTFVAEAWYVGQLGSIALAGLALAFPMMMLSMMLSAGAFGGAMTGAVAQQLGAGNRVGAENLAVHAVLLGLCMAALSSLFFLAFGGVIYSSLGGLGPVLEKALSYSDILFYGVFTNWLANSLAAIVRAAGHMFVASICLIAGSIVQVISAAILIFGWGPFPSMGIGGAAAAVTIGYFLSSMLLFYYLSVKCPELHLKILGVSIKLSPIVKILKVAALSSVNVLLTVLSVIAVTGFMARQGTDVLAGYGIGARLEFLLIPLIFGFGAASTVMVGVHFGAGQIKRGHTVGWIGAFYAAGLTGVIGCLTAVFPGIWAESFTEVQAVQEVCRSYLQVVGPFYAFFGLGLCFYFASQGAGRVLWPVLSVVVRFAIVVGGGFILISLETTTPDNFFLLIGIGMLAQAIFTAVPIQMGAWTRGLDAQKHS